MFYKNYMVISCISDGFINMLLGLNSRSKPKPFVFFGGLIYCIYAMLIAELDFIPTVQIE